MSHVSKHSEVRKRAKRGQQTRPFPTKEEKMRVNAWLKLKGLTIKWRSL